MNSSSLVEVPVGAAPAVGTPTECATTSVPVVEGNRRAQVTAGEEFGIQHDWCSAGASFTRLHASGRRVCPAVRVQRVNLAHHPEKAYGCVCKRHPLPSFPAHSWASCMSAGDQLAIGEL